MQARPTQPVRTHCPYCAFQCGMTVSGNGAEGPTIAGDPEFPVNRGQLCVKGFTAGSLLTRAGRLLQPMIRESGRLVPTSYETALDYIADRLASLRKQHGPAAVGVFGSGALTNEKAYLLGKFARVALQTPHIDYNGRLCMSSAAAAQNLAFGMDRGMPFPVSDIADTDCVLSWGTNWADTLPPIAQWFTEQRRRGGELMVVDPRASTTARAADLHLQLTPGSDLALANGMLFVALDEQLIDRDYIAERTTGFEDVRAVALQYYPARVERLTGVSEERMRQAVRKLAAAPRAMLLTGRGPEQQSKGVDTGLALINLMLALGKVGRRASGYGCLTGQGNGQGGREHGQKADQLAGYRLIEHDGDRKAIADVWGVPADSIPRAGRNAVDLVASLGDGPESLRALLVFGSNLAVALPDSDAVERQLRRAELLVVADSFLNETTQWAHVVLPTLQWAEEEGTMTNLEGRVLHRRPAVPPPDGPRSDLAILSGLASRLGHGDKFPTEPEQVFHELGRCTAGARADYSGMSYARLDSSDGMFWPCPGVGHPGTPRVFLDRFAHPDGKARFIPVEHRAAGEEVDTDFPLYLTTGRYREHYNSGAQTRLVPDLASRAPEPKLEVHPATLRQLGLDGATHALISSRRATQRVALQPSPEIRRDTVFLPFHWGGRQAANRLTLAALDPISKMPEYKLCAVRLAPCDPAGEYS